MNKPSRDPHSPTDNLLAKGYKQVLAWCSQAREESFKPEALLTAMPCSSAEKDGDTT